MTHDDIKDLIHACQVSDNEAIHTLWEQFAPRLAALATKNLPPCACRLQNEEDVAAVVLERFFSGLAHGSFAKIESRDGLWALLVTMTLRQASHVRRSAKRDPTLRTQESIDEERVSPLLCVASTEPTAQHVVSIRETLGRFFSLLNSEQQQIAHLRLQGYTIAEVAADMGVSRSLVHRKLITIREKTAFLFESLRPYSDG